MKIIDAQQIADMDKPYRTALMNSISGYKPLNLLGTISSKGKPNLCIVSSVFHMGSNPPLLGMVVRPPRPHNDSLSNIKTVGQFTLSNVQADSYRNAHQTSASYPSGISEFDECGFTAYYHEGFKPPFVAESAIKIGLESAEIIDVTLNGTTIIIGKITHILVDDEVITANGSINHVIATTVAGSGLDSYLLPRLLDKLTYAKPDTTPQTLNFDEK